MSLTPITGRPGASRQDGTRPKVTTASLRELKLRHEPITPPHHCLRLLCRATGGRGRHRYGAGRRDFAGADYALGY